jgi:hypothetical protein
MRRRQSIDGSREKEDKRERRVCIDIGNNTDSVRERERHSNIHLQSGVLY